MGALFNASASLASHPSVIASLNTHVKFVQAQVELQACESHLAAEEHQFELARVMTVHDGLGGRRCRALIEGLRLDLVGSRNKWAVYAGVTSTKSPL
ncbi:hypothetical protein BJ138DRAFT_1019149 [Hygrophoropsis aurantiaca]|uniref:Uncharacterized protein n=1 Tax=Hygrophoropsis aurantiaca TaxID=72124 RepID=A0ACB7ZUP7_9AGAM|nr:hypothetical protein BJ138DRAFT_1019149 [Hygrophoropsis aurantiaca]